MPDPLFRFSVTFALIAGTAALFLALLTWEVFRQSSFGRAIFVLTILMSGFILYHAVLMIVAVEGFFVQAFESLVYTGFAVVVWAIAWSHPGRDRDR